MKFPQTKITHLPADSKCSVIGKFDASEKNNAACEKIRKKIIITRQTENNGHGGWLAKLAVE